VDVFKLVPNKYLTQNEIDAANQVQVAELNVQNQQKFVWPANFVTAKAYIDQLSRSNALDAKRLAAVNEAIAKAEASHSKPKDVAQLRAVAVSLDKDAGAAKSPADAYRMRALASIMKQSGGASQPLQP
jgi:hypothetical protein